MRFTIERARTMARRTLMAVGASDAVATSLANATIAAELAGRRSVGFAHLLDYLDGIAEGGLRARPNLTSAFRPQQPSGLTPEEALPSLASILRSMNCRRAQASMALRSFRRRIAIPWANWATIHGASPGWDC